MLWQNSQYCRNRIVMTKQPQFLIMFDNHKKKSQLTGFSIWLLVSQTTAFLIAVQILVGCTHANTLLYVWFWYLFFSAVFFILRTKSNFFIFSGSKYKATESPAWMSRFNYNENILVNIYSPLLSLHAVWVFHSCLQKYQCFGFSEDFNLN